MTILIGNVALSSPPLGMVSRLKHIVSNRARPPSTAGLGYGKMMTADEI